mgnify:CR=1 FL=1
MGVQLGSGRVARGRRALNAEINVTPFVDVMLVLLIVFMVTAPLLVRGEEVSLPKTSSEQLPSVSQQPLSITLTADGRIFLNNERENEVAIGDLGPKLREITGAGYEQLVYLRADETAPHGFVMDVTARVRGAGYSRIAFVTDPTGEGGR